MDILFNLLVGLVTLGCGFWIIGISLSVLIIKNVKRLESFPLRERKSWPRVSLIIPARDEIEHILPATLSKLNDGYRELEIIIVDDRSVDGTREVISQLATEDPRIKPIYVDALPEKWLGKVWAMNLAVKEATGEYLLLSDADVYFSEGTITRAVNYALEKDLGQLAVIPKLTAPRFHLQSSLSVFMRNFPISTRTWEVSNPDSNAYVGIGAFGLISKKAYDKTRGFEWLRMEPADDVGLGKMLKDSGAKCDVLNGSDFVSVEWYTKIWHFVEVIQRAGISAYASFNPFIMLFLGFMTTVAELSPFIALLPVLPGWLNIVGYILTPVAVALSLFLARWYRTGLLPALFFPVGSILSGVSFIIASVRSIISGGMTWRGTFYSYKEMKNEQRIKL